MRRVSRFLISLSTALALLFPYTSLAYSEWPAISSRAMQLSLATKLPLKCCLESHAGDIYLQEPIRDYGKFVGFLLELGDYLLQHTNAGSYYMVRVHFADHVRSISVQELVRFRNKVKSDYNDPKVLYEFFSQFRNY
jgi:hypothetical protein